MAKNTGDDQIMQWVCDICGYIHVEEQPPDSCPVCGAPKSKFSEYTEADEDFLDDESLDGDDSFDDDDYNER